MGTSEIISVMFGFMGGIAADILRAYLSTLSKDRELRISFGYQADLEKMKLLLAHQLEMERKSSRPCTQASCDIGRVRERLSRLEKKVT